MNNGIAAIGSTQNFSNLKNVKQNNANKPTYQ